MQALRLILTSDIGDLCCAAYEAREWANYIATREGCAVSPWNAFLALACVRPWRRDFHDRYPAAAPWRVVRSAL